MLIALITWSSLVLAILAFIGAVFGFLEMRKEDMLARSRGKSILIVSLVTGVLFTALFGVGLYRLRRTSPPQVQSPQRVDTPSPSTRLPGDQGAQRRTDVTPGAGASSGITAPSFAITTITPPEGVRGRMITIFGAQFGSAAGVVQFADAQGTTTKAKLVQEGSCTPTPWGDTMILVSVPDLSPASYTVTVTRTDGQTSAPFPFRITNLGTRTTICRVDPERGIPNVTDVTIVGSDFGRTPGKVLFNQMIAPSIAAWTERSITVRTPPGATTGAIRVVTTEGIRSNDFAFTIGQCTQNSCSLGQACCGDGLCRQEGTCPDAGACRYRWFFSTGSTVTLPCDARGQCPTGFVCNSQTKQCEPAKGKGACTTDADCPSGMYCQQATGKCLDGTPRLIEEPGCANTVQSPTPYRGRIDACTNARFGARFSVPLDASTLTLGTLELRACGTASDFQAASCQGDSLSGDIDQIPGQDGIVGFLYRPRQSLEKETWYSMRIAQLLKSRVGIPLDASIEWHVRTGKASCALDHIEVTPPRAVVTGVGASQGYRALPTAKNCNILPHGGPWAWISKNVGQASVASMDTEETVVTAKAMTPQGGVQLESTLAQKRDTGILIVRLPAPKLVEWWPSCTGACRNAELGLRFTVPMRLASFTEKSVRLEACTDASCTSVASVGVTGFVGEENDTVVVFRSKKGLFAPAMTYRVVLVPLQILSRDGAPLAGIEGNPLGTMTTAADRYTWTFRVLDSRALCAIDHVDVAPARAILTEIFATQDFAAVPRSKPDACDARGQRLIAGSYAWAWASSNEHVARLVDQASPRDAWTRAEAEGPGQTAVSAETSGNRGIANLTVVCTAANDRDCRQGFGVGIDRCCYPRPTIRTKQPEGANACRNGVIQIQFDQPMDKGSVEKGTVVEQERDGSSCAPAVSPSPQRSASSKQKKPAQKIFCPLATQLSTSNDERIFTFVPTAILPSNVVIRVRVLGVDTGTAVNRAVQNRAGVAMAQGIEWNFTTGTAICQITTVRVYRDPLPDAIVGDTFLCARRDNCVDDRDTAKGGNQHHFRAEALDQEDRPVQATYTWTSENQRIADIRVTAGEVDVTAEENGKTSLEVHARATTTAGGLGKAIIPIDVTACENPWPAPTTQGAAVSWEPFADRGGNNPTNFSTWYCRDRGNPGPDDDLPALAWPPSIEAGFENDPKKRDLLKGFLFQVVGGGESDAIGLEIFGNPDQKTVDAWYREKFGSTGSTLSLEPLTIDGYPAIRDGRTVYVNGLNVRGNDVLTHVYLLAYGLGASQETIDIAKQLEQNLRLTTTVTDLAERSALQRDMARVLALRSMRAAIDRYRTLNGGAVPRLEAGSFIPNLTFSTWPLSWGRLGGIVGAAFPRDPTNQFGGCTKPFDTATCWNPVRKKQDPLVKQFKCPTKAFAYGYKVDPAAPGGYILATNFEYDGPGSFKRDAAYRSLDSLLGSGVCTK